jgi:hypothetical protein
METPKPNAAFLQFIDSYKVDHSEEYNVTQKSISDLRAVLAKDNVSSNTRTALELEVKGMEEKLAAMDKDYSGNPIPICFVTQTADNKDKLYVYIPITVKEKVTKDLQDLVSRLPAELETSQRDSKQETNYQVVEYETKHPRKVAAIIGYNLSGEYVFLAECRHSALTGASYAQARLKFGLPSLKNPFKKDDK